MYGDIIKEHRKIAKMSQTELAKATGIPQATISWIERTKDTQSIKDCVTLADFYGITLDELIGRDLHFPAPGDHYTQNNVNGKNNMSIKNFRK